MFWCYFLRNLGTLFFRSKAPSLNYFLVLPIMSGKFIAFTTRSHPSPFPSFPVNLVQESGNILAYEDRTSRFFPPAPRVPRMPGLVSGDTDFMDDSEDSFGELLNSSHQCFNILCSGDKDGSICFSIFGIFPIGKIVSYLIWNETCWPMLTDWFHKSAIICTEFSCVLINVILQIFFCWLFIGFSASLAFEALFFSLHCIFCVFLFYSLSYKRLCCIAMLTC